MGWLALYTMANEFPIEWDKTVLWTDKGGLMAKLGNYKSMAGQRLRKPTQFINHWDVCLSSKSCQRVLDRRGISVHFLIDNDGTIYQTMDLQHIGWHAGSSKINAKSIGVEISNAYDLKWQSWYKKNGFGERPVVTDAEVHGKKSWCTLRLLSCTIRGSTSLVEGCSLGM